MARDYTSDRLQARAGGRQASTIPDTRRSSVVPLGDEGRKSHERETTPRPAGTGPPLRRQRKYQTNELLLEISSLCILFLQLNPST